MRAKYFWIATALAAAAICGLAALLYLAPQRAFTTQADDISETVMPLLAGIACLFAGRRRKGRMRWGWVLLGASALAWALGQGAWTWQELILRQKPAQLFPSYPDLGYLSAVPLAIAGLLLFPGTGRDWGGRVRLVLDGCIVAAALLFVSWISAFGPLFEASGGDLLSRVLGLSYPVSDLVMVTIVITTLLRVPRSSQVTILTIGLGIAANAVADTGFNYLTQIQQFSTTNLIDVGWVIGYAFIALAALRELAFTHAPDTETAKRVSSFAVMLPYVTVIAAVFLGIYKRVTSGDLSAFLYLDGLALISFVLLRQLFLLIENRALNRGLEERVLSRTAELQKRTQELESAKQRLLDGERRFRTIFEQSTDLIATVDEELQIRNITSSVRRLLLRDAENTVGTSFADLVHPEDRRALQRAAEQARAQSGENVTLELRLADAGGGWHLMETTISNLLAEPAVAALVLSSHEITDRKALEDQLAHQALHDTLTDLPNRVLFEDRLQNALQRFARGETRGIGVVIVDLDDFKIVNDTLGHTAADTVLLEVSNRFRGELRAGDTLARMVGDEFAILLEGLVNHAQLEQIARRLLKLLEAPVEVDGHAVVLRASIGVAMAGKDGANAEALLRDAELAVYRAKMSGGGRAEFFEKVATTGLRDRLQLQSEIQGALEDHQLFLEYQPVVSLTEGKVIGFEALVRWHHPQRGIISPLDFISIAEQTGLIIPIGEWVLDSACKQLRQTRAALGRDDLTMAVNISARQLRTTAIVHTVSRTLVRYKLPASALILEVTESVLIEDLASIGRLLNELRAVGVGLALDDFGTGYSSLSYLQQIPVNQIKIDRSFVKEMLHNQGTATLVRAIIEMGRAFGLEIVAEGIEGLAESQELVQMRCVVGQGFYFSRPVAPEVAVELAAKGFADRLNQTADQTSSGSMSTQVNEGTSRTV